ncbi:MAG: FtsX-like permease family protein [Ruminococcus sp.]|jgi:putative ABC transport system permease protein|nr:FtsX-like permease family protein [Ruminococcus sp.]
MSKKPLSTIRLSVNNLRQKPYRTFALTALVFLLAFTLFGGSVLTKSLQNGLHSLQARLGADLAVLPLGHDSDYEGILLSGTPSKFYFDKSVESQLARVDGIEQVSSQFYMSSLSAECCSVPIQIIGIDPKTDFVTMPWISEVYENELRDNQLIVGYDILTEENKELKFFGNEYKIAAQLEETSTGMDCSVFVNMNTIESLIEGAREQGINLNTDVKGVNAENSISSVLIKVKTGYELDTVVTNIRQSVDNVAIIRSKTIISGTAGHIGIIINYFYIIAFVLWILAALVLAVVFSTSVHERKKEFAVFRILGATRRKLSGIVLAEAFLTGIIGGLTGIIAVSLVVFPFGTWISDRLNLPYLQPNIGVIVGLLAFSLLLSIAVPPLTAIYSAVKISRAETYTVLREGE